MVLGNNAGVGITAKYDEEKIGTDCNTELSYTLLIAQQNPSKKLHLSSKLAESQYDKSFCGFYICWYARLHGAASTGHSRSR